MRLNGKRALITGGGRGIGRAYVERFLDEGADIVIGDIDEKNAASTAEELSALGKGKVEFVLFDVSDPEAVTAGVERAAQILGGIDILVNNAALLADWKKDDHSYENLLRVFAVNTHSLWLMTRAAAPHLIASDAGRIVNQASTASFAYAYAAPEEYAGLDSYSYSQSKRAVVGLTKLTAGQLGHYGVTVNAIAPGVVHTTAMANVDPAVIDKLDAAKPIKGAIQASDIAGAAVYFASDEAKFVTGQVLVIDGGRIMPAG